MNVYIKFLLAALLGIIINHFVKYIPTLGFHITVYRHTPGPCHLVSGIENGSEDVMMLEGDLAIISSGIRDLTGNQENPLFAGRKGRIYLFDFSKPHQEAKPFTIVGKFDEESFMPHGISLWKDNSGKSYLYVINHKSKGNHVVEKFSVNKKSNRLVHMRTFWDEQFRLVNDLVMTGEDAFYITNYMYSMSAAGLALEKFLMRKLGQVLHFNTDRTKVVLTDLFVPNGINFSLDRQTLYLAQSGYMDVTVYDIESDFGLTLRQTFETQSRVDNLEIEQATGHIWTGSHPIPWKFRRHTANLSKPAPSQVLRLRVENDVITEVDEVYADDTGELHGSSVAVAHKGAMLVGTVYHKLLYCKLYSLQT